MRHLVAALAASLTLALPAFSQKKPTWAEAKSTTSPTARVTGALSYDSVRGRTVLFGGLSSTFDYLNDTWEWNGTTWTKQSPTTSPPARNGVTAYDSARGQTVLFGGSLGSFQVLGDTWEYDGTSWGRRRPAASPAARGHQGMAYDSGRKRTVLFGGEAGARFGDTWEWNGTTWAQRTPATSPPARSCHAMAYDSGRKRTVVFGGITGTYTFLADTWEWDGTTWKQIKPATSPPARAGSMVYDPVRKRTVLFGGFDGKQSLADTWEWDGTTWTKATTAVSPTARSHHGLAFDNGRNHVVAFGGHGTAFRGDTWLYGAFSQASYATFGSGCISAAPGCQPALDRAWTRTLAGRSTTATQIAFLEVPNKAMNVCGANLWCKAKSGPVDVTIALHELDLQTGNPGKVLRSGKVRVTTQVGEYGATWAPRSFTSNDVYLISFDNADKLDLPISRSGQNSLHYELKANKWSGPFQNTPWQYRIWSDRMAAVPVLAGSGRPLLGSTMRVVLSKAPPGRVGVMFLGASDMTWGAFRLPLDLAPVAPGCKVWASGEALVGFVTDNDGGRTVGLPIPSSTALKDVVFFNQFLISDPKANSLGWIMTGGGKATIGDV